MLNVARRKSVTKRKTEITKRTTLVSKRLSAECSCSRINEISERNLSDCRVLNRSNSNNSMNLDRGSRGVREFDQHKSQYETREVRT